MSKYKNINSSIIYYVLTITLDVSSIGTHTHLLVLLIYYRIIRLLLLTTYSVRYYLNELYSRYVRTHFRFCIILSKSRWNIISSDKFQRMLVHNDVLQLTFNGKMCVCSSNLILSFMPQHLRTAFKKLPH